MNKRALAGIATVTLALTGLTPSMARASGDPGVIANFEGHTLDLATGWGDARACYSDDQSTRCYRTATDMDAAEHTIVHPLTACGSALVLFDGTSYGGATLALSTRNTALVLSSYGFDNKTSSYTIGACSARFYDTASLGTLYPGATGAGASASSMVSGWDNRISSVFIS